MSQETPPTDPTLNPSGLTDERVFFSKETETWRYEDEDGAEWEWDVAKNKWAQVVRHAPSFSWSCAMHVLVNIGPKPSITSR